MPTRHTVQQGDSVVKLAEQYGLFVATIEDHPDNKDLKNERGNMDALQPGDILAIPDKTEKVVSAAAETKHRFKRKGVPAIFRIQLFDNNIPRADQDYRLDIDGHSTEGMTDADGVLETALPTNAAQGKLVIGPDLFEMTFLFGGMDPIEEISGVQMRLKNLGYSSGSDSNELNDEIRKALRHFQADFELEETGEPDSDTLAKLADVHDNVADMPEE